MNTPPTNEPKMPEVLMVEPFSLNATHLEDFNAEVERNRVDLSKWKAYHHDDKVQELKNQLEGMVNGHSQDQLYIEKLEGTLRKCVEAFKANEVAVYALSVDDSQAEELCAIAGKIIKSALTKASNLLK